MPKIAREGLSIIHTILGLRNAQPVTPSFADVVLVSIDTENTQAIRHGSSWRKGTQVGLAILDTRKLNGQVKLGKIVKTYNFATGPPSYQEKASRKFSLGKSVPTSMSGVAGCINTLIPSDRNVVLFGHGIHNDIMALKTIDVEFPAMISAVIDTYFIADEVFGPGSGPRSLSGLLRSLGRPCSQYHSAGNDANYALMALLLLAIRGLAKEDADAKRIMVRLLRKVSIFQSTTL